MRWAGRKADDRFAAAVDELAEKIEQLIEHPETWPVMGRQRRRRVERYLNITRLNKRLEKIFQGLLALQVEQAG
jgi:colanic acid/amylovoran biosynthesis glycosyltransferase